MKTFRNGMLFEGQCRDSWELLAKRYVILRFHAVEFPTLGHAAPGGT